MALKDELPRSIGAQYAAEKSVETAPEGMKRLSQTRKDMDVSGGESKI